MGMATQSIKGKGTSNAATSGQPTMGRPNQNVPAPYTNTVGQWDNAQIPTVQQGAGKGKGA